MMYLIAQLGLWLLLAAAFAALAGWAMASERLAPSLTALRREREGLLRDLSMLASGEAQSDAAGERESDSMRRLLEVRDGRIAELEQALGKARERADEAVSRLAERERAPAPSPQENEELSRLRALTAQYENERAREVEVVAAPVVEDESQALHAWRLRYFEQRVKYLEGKAPTPVAEAEPPLEAWRAREAEARAAHLEAELRVARATPAPAPVEAFAANAEIDMMLRWRMLYLERRAAYLQEELAGAPQLDPAQDRWKWRARYLEARVRHLQQQTTPAPARTTPPAAPEVAPPPAAPAHKPATLAAPRDGAPDDFTLIEDVSVLQQTTLYSLGVFHFDQLAAWTPENVAWVDRYLRLRGRIEREEWVEQAQALVREGVAASRRMLADEEA